MKTIAFDILIGLTCLLSMGILSAIDMVFDWFFLTNYGLITLLVIVLITLLSMVWRKYKRHQQRENKTYPVNRFRK